MIDFKPKNVDTNQQLVSAYQICYFRNHKLLRENQYESRFLVSFFTFLSTDQLHHFNDLVFGHHFCP